MARACLGCVLCECGPSGDVNRGLKTPLPDTYGARSTCLGELNPARRELGIPGPRRRLQTLEADLKQRA